MFPLQELAKIQKNVNEFAFTDSWFNQDLTLILLLDTWYHLKKKRSVLHQRCFNVWNICMFKLHTVKSMAQWERYKWCSGLIEPNHLLTGNASCGNPSSQDRGERTCSFIGTKLIYRKWHHSVLMTEWGLWGMGGRGVGGSTAEAMHWRLSQVSHGLIAALCAQRTKRKYNYSLQAFPKPWNKFFWDGLQSN